MGHLSKYKYSRKSVVLLMVLGILFPVIPGILLLIAILKPKIENEVAGARVLGIIYLLIGVPFAIFAISSSGPGELQKDIQYSLLIFGPWAFSGVMALIYASKQGEYLEKAGEVVFRAMSGMTSISEISRDSAVDRQSVVAILRDGIRLGILREYMIDRAVENIVRSWDIRKQYSQEKVDHTWRCGHCGAQANVSTLTGETPVCPYCHTPKGAN